MIDEKLQSAVSAVIDPSSGKLKGNSIRVTIKGRQETGGYRNQVRERTISITLNNAEAQQFVSNPSYETLGEAYGLDGSFFFGDPEGVEVESLHITVLP